MFVEDNAAFIELINGLAGIGEIKVAKDYKDRAAIFNHEKPDIILLDIHLPGKSRLELLKYIRGTGSLVGCW